MTKKYKITFYENKRKIKVSDFDVDAETEFDAIAKFRKKEWDAVFLELKCLTPRGL